LSGVRLLKVVLTLCALVSIGAAVGPIISRKVVVQILAKTGGASYEPVHRRLSIASVARRYPPVAYNSATAEEAGGAYQRLMRRRSLF
jgi:hypothetical protein